MWMWTFGGSSDVNVDVQGSQGVIWGECGHSCGSSEVNVDVQIVVFRGSSEVNVDTKRGHLDIKGVIWGEYANSSEVTEDIQWVICPRLGRSWTFFRTGNFHMWVRGVIWWQCGRSGGHLMTMWTLSGVIWTLRWICKFRGVIWGEWGHSGHLSWMWTFRGVLHLPSSSMWFWTILHLNFILNISSLANNLYQLPNLVAL